MDYRVFRKQISMISNWPFFLLLILIGRAQSSPSLPITPTRGGVVPLPQEIQQTKEFFILRPVVFRFNITSYSCNILDKAIKRYSKIIWNSLSGPVSRKILYDDINFSNSDSKTLEIMNVHLENPCNNDDLPHLFMVENYTIMISNTEQKIQSTSIWGILRGLETFSQLAYKSEDIFAALQVNFTFINDYPRFPHRGLLLDTSRHFLPLKYIFKTLDAMAFNKLNVFHWHIVDDQSFPYKSTKFPELSNMGAYTEAAVYQPNDVQAIIDYAKNRGIRVLTEFDTPGHTLSWGKGIKGILTECVGIADEYGPMDPSKSYLYDFLEELFSEISKVFPDRYVHLGGDEVPFDCWQSNPNITDFMKRLNISGNYEGLESYYIQKLEEIVTKKGLKPIVWEEVFNNGAVVEDATIIHVWKDDYQNTLSKVTKAGKPALLSSCWYLDILGDRGHWEQFYECDPHKFPGEEEQKKLVLGGEACMWGELVNEFNVISRVWPRASPAAEKLWSNISKSDDYNISPSQLQNFKERLEEHTCRMNNRGIEAPPPTGPSICL